MNGPHNYIARHHRWPKCTETGFLRFGERWDARQALEHAAHVRARAENEGATTHYNVRRVYHCVFCGGWHLTCQAPRIRASRVPTAGPGIGL